MTELQISLTDEAAQFVEHEAKARGLRTSSDLIQALVDHEKTRSQANLDQMLVDGLDSGPSFPITDEWWEQKRNQLAARLQGSEK